MRYAFIHGIILDGTKDMKEEHHKIILTNDDNIASLLPDTTDPKVLEEQGYEVIDLKGKYIMPGLINMHVHLAGNGKPQKKQRDNTKLVERIFKTALGRAIAHKLVKEYATIELMSGVTTIRTVGGLRDLDTTIRDEIMEGKALGPRMLVANEAISVPTGHMAGSVAIIAHNKEEAIKQVHHLKAKEADLVKLMITGGVMDADEKGVPGVVKMSQEMVREVCKEAHKLGFKVAAHVESPDGVMIALNNGVDTIEHGAAPGNVMLKTFKEKQAALITTISPTIPYALFDRSISHTNETEQYNGKVVFDGIVNCAIEAIRNDIPVGLGNDVGCPWITQYDFWRELVYFTKYVGVTNKFALYTATLGNAQIAGISKRTGSIEAGKCADMIVTENNPLEDLHALRHVDMVMARGQLIKNPKVKRNEAIDEQLDPFC